MKIIRDKTWKAAEKAMVREMKILTAHRWLAEFDELLEPLWQYLLNETYPNIEMIRESMRERFKK